MSLLYIQGEKEKEQHVHYEVDTSLPALGEGGMGQVLRGVRVDETNGLRTDVAIKFLFEDLPDHAIKRARREASIQIHNENLIEMFGFIEIVENPSSSNPVKRYHVVSELLEGVMLFDLLQGKTTDRYGNQVEFAQELYAKYQNDRLGFSILIIKNVLSGLMALHDKGYIHRDLDPSNIMITSDRKIKLIDFGIAKKINSSVTQDQQLTSSGQFIGKAAYAAPELVLGDIQNQNPTTDLYAVGIMFYQFIVGKLPYEGTMAELIDQQIHAKMPLKQIAAKPLRNIIAKATAKKQSDRYQSAAEMRVDLEHASKADLTPTKTAMENVSELMKKSPKGKKAGVLIGVAGTLVALVLAAVLILPRLSANSTNEEAAVAQVKKPANEVIDSPEDTVIVDKKSGVRQSTIGHLIAESLKKMETENKAKEGLEQLTGITNKYANYKSTARALAILSALTQPEDATVSSAQIKSLRQATANHVQRNAAKAHGYAEKAVKLDPTCYQAVFELATDYVAGAVRTGDASLKNPQKSLQLFTDGIKHAQNANDVEYVNLFNTRIEQVKNVVGQ